MIKTKDTTKTYKNGFTAVNNLNLHVEKGDMFGFLGPNGAGKTTTIRMLTGLLTPTSGSVYVDGMNVAERPVEVKRVIGVVPESHGYYYWMNPMEYLIYFAALFGVPKDEANKRANDLLDKVGLSEKKKVPIGQFSRGMKQRLGIAKSLVNNPKVIFLDEPTLGLDPIGQKEVQNLILDINKAQDITVFITSHLLKDIEALCNKVCIVQKGKMIEQGSIEDLEQKYSAADMEDVFFKVTGYSSKGDSEHE